MRFGLHTLAVLAIAVGAASQDTLHDAAAVVSADGATEIDTPSIIAELAEKDSTISKTAAALAASQITITETQALADASVALATSKSDEVAALTAAVEKLKGKLVAVEAQAAAAQQQSERAESLSKGYARIQEQHSALKAELADARSSVVALQAELAMASKPRNATEIAADVSKLVSRNSRAAYAAFSKAAAPHLATCKHYTMAAASEAQKIASALAIKARVKAAALGPYYRGVVAPMALKVYNEEVVPMLKAAKSASLRAFVKARTGVSAAFSAAAVAVKPVYEAHIAPLVKAHVSPTYNGVVLPLFREHVKPLSDVVAAAARPLLGKAHAAAVAIPGKVAALAKQQQPHVEASLAALTASASLIVGAAAKASAALHDAAVLELAKVAGPASARIVDCTLIGIATLTTTKVGPALVVLAFRSIIVTVAWILNLFMFVLVAIFFSPLRLFSRSIQDDTPHKAKSSSKTRKESRKAA